MPSKDLIVRIGANTKELERSLKSAQAKVKLFSAGLATLSTAAALSFRQFSNFEKDFSNVVTLLDQGSFKTKTLNEGIDDLRKGVMDVAKSSGETFENLNKSLFDLISAGVDAEKAVEALSVSTNLAIAGATNTSVAVDGLTSALNAYELEADQAQSVAEKFFTAQKFGKTTIEELSSGFGLVGSSAKEFGVSLDELLAATAAVTSGGITTSAAYTGLNAVLANISQPTAAAVKEAKRLGIEFNSTALRTKGLKGFLDEMTGSANFNKESVEKLFGSVEAKKIIFALAGAQAKKFSETLGEIGDESQSAATYQAALEEKMGDADRQTKRLQSSIQSASIVIGEMIAPEVISFMADLTDGVNENADSIRLLGRTIGKFLQILALAKDLLLGVANVLLNVVAGAFAKVQADIIRVSGAIDKLRGKTAEANEKFAMANEINRQAGANTKEAFSDTTSAVTEDINSIFGVNLNTGKDDNESLQAALEERNRIEDENYEARKELEAERRELQLEEDAEKHEEDLELLQERLEDKQVKNDQATKKEIQAKSKGEKQLEKVKKQRVEAEKKLDLVLVDSAFDTLSTIVGDNKAAQTAILVARKAMAVSNILVNAQEAASLAIATIPPPAGEAVAAQRLAMGNIQAAIVAATAIPEIAGTFAAKTGGIVPGSGFGDKVPFMLEPGEAIIPKKLTPTLMDILGGEPSVGSGTREISVEIGLDDQASQLLTLRQREDRILGVSQ